MRTAEAMALPTVTREAPADERGRESFEVQAIRVFRQLGHRVDAETPRIAHIGCRGGNGTLAIARQFPHARTVGVDCGKDNACTGREAARQQGLEHRVHFHTGPADQFHLRGRFDLIFVSDPQRFANKHMLSWLRNQLTEDGEVVLAGIGAAGLAAEARVGEYREVDVAFVGCGREVCVLKA